MLAWFNSLFGVDSVIFGSLESESEKCRNSKLMFEMDENGENSANSRYIESQGTKKFYSL